MEDNKEIDQAILEGLSLCRGVVQRYLAYLQGMAPEVMFPNGIQSTNEVGFQDKQGRQWHMKLDIVDDPYYVFPIERCPGEAVKQMMQKIVLHLQAVLAWVLESEVRPGDVPRPELFMDAKFALTPHSSVFLWSREYGREIHDSFPRRIAFVWSNSNAS